MKINRIENLTGKRLRMSRIDKKMTLGQVAKNIGVSTNTLRRYENGEIKRVPKDKIEKLSLLYEKSPTYFYGWIDFTFCKSIHEVILYILQLKLGLNKEIEDYLESIPKFKPILTFFKTRSLDENGIPALTKDEEKEFRVFRNHTFDSLDTEENFDGKDCLHLEEMLKAFYYTHLIKRNTTEKTMEKGEI
ncbi:helix-turn-helix domain-containing protein [Fusobacterium sp. PH5-44]|uniref:helix-turn-helix domain-containing protein n=1 Tax=unclassified Fusobacterium TaxID=2648384 RepID=UPI003D2252AE